MHWWPHAARSMILKKCDDEAKCYHLFVTGTRTQMVVACISYMFWAKTAEVLGCHVVESEVKLDL